MLKKTIFLLVATTQTMFITTSYYDETVSDFLEQLPILIRAHNNDPFQKTLIYAQTQLQSNNILIALSIYEQVYRYHRHLYVNYKDFQNSWSEEERLKYPELYLVIKKQLDTEMKQAEQELLLAKIKLEEQCTISLQKGNS